MDLHSPVDTNKVSVNIKEGIGDIQVDLLLLFLLYSIRY